MPQSTFATEVLKALPSYLASDDAQNQIKDALNNNFAGDLGRIFNKLAPPKNPENTDYLNALSAYEKGELDKELRGALLPIAQGIFNEDMSDLNEEIKKSIGPGNYENLVKSYTLPTLIDSIISSLAIVYSYATVEQFVKSNPMPVEVDSPEYSEWEKKSTIFQDTIQAGLRELNASKDFLTSSDTEKLEHVDPVVPNDGLKFLQEFQKMISTFQEELNSLTKICKSNHSVEAIKVAKSQLRAMSDKVETIIERYNTSSEIDTNRANIDLTTGLTNLQKNITDNINRAQQELGKVKEPPIRTAVEKFLNAITRLFSLGFYGYESRAEKAQKELAASSEKLTTLKSFAEFKEGLNKVRDVDEPGNQNPKKPAP